MFKHIVLGREGEDIAVNFLINKKYRICDKNWRRKYGEIDIVAISPNGVLTFVEVKTLKYNGNGLMPEDHMTFQKSEKFKRIATAYANQHSELISENRGWQCDVLALTKIENDFVIRHYENV